MFSAFLSSAALVKLNDPVITVSLSITMTLLLLRTFRNTERVARTPNSEKALEMEKKGATIEEMRPLIAGTMGQSMLQHGNVDEGIMSVGQCIGLIGNIPTVKEVIDKIIEDAGKIINDRLVKFAKI